MLWTCEKQGAKLPICMGKLRFPSCSRFRGHRLGTVRGPVQWNLDMKGQGTGNNITGYNEVSFNWVFFFHIFYYYWGKENILLHQGLCYIEVHYIEVPLYHFKLFIVFNTGKDGRDGRDSSGIKVGFFKLQTLLSLLLEKFRNSN